MVDINSIKLEKPACNSPLIVDISSSPSSNEGTPLRPVLCLKKREQLKEFEEKDDCFILDFDPYDPLDISKLSVSKNGDSPDVSVVAERGQVACRDYPHSRHLCLKYPFDKMPHESYCELCYCYVCDVAAPCTYWTAVTGHCHAFENEAWKSQRMATRK